MRLSGNMCGSHRSSPAQRARDTFPEPRREQRVLQPSLGFVDVLSRRDHVEVAHQQGRHFAVEQVLRVHCSASSQASLYSNLGPGFGLPFGAYMLPIRTPHIAASMYRLCSRFGSPGSARRISTGSPTSTQQRDSVPALLSVPDRGITERLDRVGRKWLVSAFELLQPDDVGPELLEPGFRTRKPPLIPLML